MTPTIQSQLLSLTISDLQDPKLLRLNRNFKILFDTILGVQQSINAPPISSSDNLDAGGVSTATVTLSNAFQVIPGAGVVLSRSGTWLVIGNFEFVVATADGTASGGIYDGNLLNGLAEFAGNGTGSVSRSWIYNTPGNAKLQLQAKKSGGGGTGTCVNPGTAISAVWLHA